jgi:hypothetical protein
VHNNIHGPDLRNPASAPLPHAAGTLAREGPDTRRMESVKDIRHALHAADRVRVILLDLENWE